MKLSIIPLLFLSPTLLLADGIAPATTTKSVSLTIETVKAPELTGRVLGYTVRYAPKGRYDIGLSIPIRLETEPDYILEMSSISDAPFIYVPKDLPEGTDLDKLRLTQKADITGAFLATGSFSHPAAKHLNIAHVNIGTSQLPKGDYFILNGYASVLCTKGSAESAIIPLSEDSGTFSIEGTEARYKRIIMQGEEAVEIAVSQVPKEFEQFSFYDEKGKKMNIHRRSSRVSNGVGNYKLGFLKGKPASISYSYKIVPLKVSTPFQMKFLAGVDYLPESQEGEYNCRVAAFTLPLDASANLEQGVTGNIELIVLGPAGVEFGLDGEQELQVTTEGENPEVLGTIRLRPEDFQQEYRTKTMRIEAALPAIEDHTDIRISGELKLKNKGGQGNSVASEIKGTSGDITIAGTRYRYSWRPGDKDTTSPWRTLVLSTPDNPEQIMDRGSSINFSDDKGTRVGGVETKLHPSQLKNIEEGGHGSNPVKAYRFRPGSIPSHIQVGGGNQTNSSAIPVGIKLHLGASHDIPAL